MIRDDCRRVTEARERTSSKDEQHQECDQDDDRDERKELPLEFPSLRVVGGDVAGQIGPALGAEFRLIPDLLAAFRSREREPYSAMEDLFPWCRT